MPDDEPTPPPPEANDGAFPERQFAVHVFTVAAAQVGVCFTGIGLVRLLNAQNAVGRVADDLLAFDALGFLVTSVVAYLGLRTRSATRRRRLERAADVLILLSLALMVLVGALLAYELL